MVLIFIFIDHYIESKYPKQSCGIFKFQRNKFLKHFRYILDEITPSVVKLLLKSYNNCDD